MKEKLWDARGEMNPRRRQQIELTIAEIKEIHEGAFAHFHEHPVFRAVLIPFGGAGLVGLIEFLSNLF